jgi:hypothetical protein
MRCAGIDIFGWLDGIPLRDQENSGVDSSSPFVDEATSIYKGRPSKRQRLDPPTPPSSSEHRKRRPATKTQGPTTTTPSPIVAAMSGLSPSRRKRSHAECNDGDDKDETPSGADDAQVDDRTPRATRRLKPTRGLWSGSEHSLGTASSSSASASGYSSPHRQLGQLELRTQGFRIRELSALEDAGPAPLLAELVERLEGVSRGKAIVPPTVREAALQLPAARAQRFRWARDEYCVGVARDALGATPAPEVVLDVLDAAAECSANGHAEATWNTEVHQQILHMGLRRPERPRFGQLVNFFAWYVCFPRYEVCVWIYIVLTKLWLARRHPSQPSTRGRHVRRSVSTFVSI